MVISIGLWWFHFVSTFWLFMEWPLKIIASLFMEPWQSMFKSSLSHGFSPWIFSIETPFVPYGAMGIPQFQSQKRRRFAEELLRRFFSFGTPVVIASEEPKRKLDFLSWVVALSQNRMGVLYGFIYKQYLGSFLKKEHDWMWPPSSIDPTLHRGWKSNMYPSCEW